MKQSLRSLRMAQHHRRHKPGGLNVVALMDIFTILVVFLLVNSTDVQNLPSTRVISLPESNVESKPRETVMVLVTPDSILVQNRSVLSTAEAMASGQTVLAPLRAALREQADRRLTAAGEDAADLGEVTVLGDKSIPFELLKKVMASCTDAGYSTVSLAVQQKGLEQG